MGIAKLYAQSTQAIANIPSCFTHTNEGIAENNKSYNHEMFSFRCLIHRPALALVKKDKCLL
jgi:hypothetical protein